MNISEVLSPVPEGYDEWTLRTPASRIRTQTLPIGPPGHDVQPDPSLRHAPHHTSTSTSAATHEATSRTSATRKTPDAARSTFSFSPATAAPPPHTRQHAAACTPATVLPQPARQPPHCSYLRAS